MSDGRAYLVVRNATFKLYIRKNFFVNNVFHVSTVNSSSRTNGLETRSCRESHVYVFVLASVSVFICGYVCNVYVYICVYACECVMRSSSFAACARLHSHSDTCDRASFSCTSSSLPFAPYPCVPRGHSFGDRPAIESPSRFRSTVRVPRCDLVLSLRYKYYQIYCVLAALFSRIASSSRHTHTLILFLFSPSLSLSTSRTAFLVVIHGTRTKKSPMYFPSCFT